MPLWRKAGAQGQGQNPSMKDLGKEFKKLLVLPDLVVEGRSAEAQLTFEN
jgi:hypothetical protein